MGGASLHPRGGFCASITGLIYIGNSRLMNKLNTGLLILIIMRRILEKKLSFFAFLAISLLPWLHVRLLPLSLILGVIGFYLLLKNRSLNKFSVLLFSIVLVSISSYFFYLDLAYGSFLPTKRFELFGVLTSSGDILTNLINILIDRQYGLFIYSPIFIIIIPIYYGGFSYQVF